MAAASNQAGPALHFEPPPDELDQYEHLFSMADSNQTGQLNGRQAVDFFSKSQQPLETLKNVWTMSDNPKTNSLDKSKFFVAVRLIQLYQNHQKAQGPGLDVTPGTIMRPPFFEGIPPPPSTSQPSSKPQLQLQPQPPTQESQIQTKQQDSIASSATALAAQDPYMMQPSEQVRYDQLFPQYEKDGFVYGKEAVELFSKSGLSKNILRDVWNLVDDMPVDNRLSKLEFALAMHLIVCVSKKNLPMPVVLPPSLKRMKSQEIAPGTLSRNSSDQVISPAASSSPSRQSIVSNGGGTTTTTAAAVGGPPSINQPINNTAGFQQAQTLQSNGMAISDAFNDLSVDNSGQSSVGLPAIGAPPPSMSEPPSIARSAGPLSTSAASVSEATNNTSQTSVYVHPTANGVNNGTEEELEKVRSVLQKLQAENVSLKAQLGQFSEEEKHVRGEITSTVTEIGELSQELTTLRKQVVEAKASLIEATSDLKAKIELKDTLKDLVKETESAKDGFDSGMSYVADIRETMESQKATVSQESTAKSNFFGYESNGNNSHGVTNDGYVDVSATYYGVGSTPIDPTVMGSYAVTPSQNSTVASVTSSKRTTYITSNENKITPEQIEQLKSEALRADKEATNADTFAKDKSVQLDNLRSEVDRAQVFVNEKQNAKSKKKGFMRGGNNKALKKEIEHAQEEASSKAQAAQNAEVELAAAQTEALRLNRRAEEARKAVEDAEIQMAKQISERDTQMAEHSQAPVPPVPTSQPSEQIQQTVHPYPNYGVMPGTIQNVGMTTFDGFDSTFAPPPPTNDPPPPPEPLQAPQHPYSTPVELEPVQSQPLNHTAASDIADNFDQPSSVSEPKDVAVNTVSDAKNITPSMSMAYSFGESKVESASIDGGIPSPTTIPTNDPPPPEEPVQLQPVQSQPSLASNASEPIDANRGLDAKSAPSPMSIGYSFGQSTLENTSMNGGIPFPTTIPTNDPPQEPVQLQPVQSQPSLASNVSEPIDTNRGLDAKSAPSPMSMGYSFGQSTLENTSMNGGIPSPTTTPTNDPPPPQEPLQPYPPEQVEQELVQSQPPLPSNVCEPKNETDTNAISDVKTMPPAMSMGYSFGQSTVGSTSMDGGIPSPTNSMADEYANPFGDL